MQVLGPPPNPAAKPWSGSFSEITSSSCASCSLAPAVSVSLSLPIRNVRLGRPNLQAGLWPQVLAPSRCPITPQPFPARRDRRAPGRNPLGVRPFWFCSILLVAG